jgi:hypothetical protein
MTYPSVGNEGPSVPAGGRDASDDFGPTIVGDNGIEVPRAVFHTDSGYVVHTEATADTAGGPPMRDSDGDDRLPDVPRYEGPAVAEQAPLINPSAGDQGPAEQGMADVNPQGPAPAPGTVGPTSDRVVYPDTTQDVYPR